MSVTYRMLHNRHCLIACVRKNLELVASDWKLKDKVFNPVLMAISCMIGEIISPLCIQIQMEDYDGKTSITTLQGLSVSPRAFPQL